MSSNEVKVLNPYAAQAGGNRLPDGVNAGTVTIEVQRAIAEVQAKLMIAKSMPRDPVAAWEKVMKACSLPGMAEAAFYSYKRGSQEVTGPSIRLAEALASAWGNIDYGMRELSNKDGVTELEAYAWDLETNTLTTQRFTVHHKRDTKSGGYALTDQRDIYELGANMGARRMRARILAVLPADIVKAAEEKCRQTLAGGSGLPLSERVKTMLTKFAPFGVTQKHVETYLDKKLVDIMPDDIVSLIGIYNSIKDGNTTASEAFEQKTEQPLVKNPEKGKAGGDNAGSTTGATTGKATETGGAIQDPQPKGSRSRKPADKPADKPVDKVEPEPKANEPGDLDKEEAAEPKNPDEPMIADPAGELGDMFGDGSDPEQTDPIPGEDGDDDAPF